MVSDYMSLGDLIRELQALAEEHGENLPVLLSAWNGIIESRELMNPEFEVQMVNDWWVYAKKQDPAKAVVFS